MDIQNPQDAQDAQNAQSAPEEEAHEGGLALGDPAASEGADPEESVTDAPAAPPAAHDDSGVTAAATSATSAASDTPADETEATPAPLAEGTIIGGFRIIGVAPADERGRLYLAEPEDAAALAEEERPGLRYSVRELGNDETNDRLAHIIATGLRHPALLTPVALARADGRSFIVSMEIADEQGRRAPTMSVGERLRPVDALRAGIELADTLAAMHHNGLAHLHISPESVTLYEGRIYLGGVEEATEAGPVIEEAQPLFARDANFLARTMGVIGGVVDTPALEEESSAQRSLREIALRGEAGTFTRAEELAESFALTLQAIASAGAETGDDIRAVRLAVSADAVTSVGLVRKANQDAYSIAFFDVHDDAAADAPVGVFIVADGMGGEAHGEIASRLVARAVTAEMTRQFTLPVTIWPSLTVFDPEDAVANAPRLSLAQALEQAVKEANRQTRAFGQRLNATTGSTVTALGVSGARAAIAHLGDSRAYLLRDSQLLQLTEDHSLLARMEALKHPLLDDPSFVVPRSVLYRSVGQEEDVSPDMMEFVVIPGDRIVLCSDGLWDELPPQVIGQTMSNAASPRACAAELVALANAAGGNDNSTAVAIFFAAEPEDDALARLAAFAAANGAEAAPTTDDANSAATLPTDEER